MATTTSTEQLEKRIEQLIREHIAEVRRRTAVAVARGFASARPKAATSRTASRRASRRRAPDEIGGLGDRLYAAVCAHPGATMATLAPVVGASARELNRPMQLLKRTGRLRSAGQRQATRYFPMTPKAAR